MTISTSLLLIDEESSQLGVRTAITRIVHGHVQLEWIGCPVTVRGSFSCEGNWILAKRIQAADCYEREWLGDGLWLRSGVHGGSESGVAV